MKLFLKHILRSIRKSLIQPIIILLTLTISVATFITAAKLAINVYKENNDSKNVDNYVSDITVKLSKSNDVRFLFSDDAESIIADDGKVQGEFGLTALVNRNDKSSLVDVCATDFYTADGFFDLKFTEYGAITEKNLNGSIIISTKTAQNYDLVLGDIFTLSLLGTRLELKVEGIAVPSGVLSDSVGIINIGAIAEALAKANPSIAALGDSIVPYTALKIQINDKSRIDEFIGKLSADERFDDMLIVKESENLGTADFLNLISVLLISIAAAIIIVISVVVISTALDLLSKKRMKDSALFMLCGADAAQLNRILYLECLIYSALAAIFGLLLSIPFANGINAIFEWTVPDVKFKGYDIALAIIASPVIVILTALIHARKTGSASIFDRVSGQFENRIDSPKLKTSVVFLALFVASVIVTYLIPVRHRYVSAILGMTFLICFIYTFVPFFISWISSLFVRLFEKMKKVPPRLTMALKNTQVSYPLKHACRLVTLLVTLICTVFASLNVLTSQTAVIESVVDCEYISLGANGRSDAIIESLDEVEDTFRISLVKNLVTEENTGLFGLSVSPEDIEYIHPDIAPKKIPEGNEIVVTSGVAKLGNLKVGDSITLNYETNNYTFKIIEVIFSNANVVLLDSAYVGDENELLCIKTNAKKNTEEFLRISNALELRGAAIVERCDLLSPVTNRVNSFGDLLFYVVNIALFTTLLGILNILFSSYVVRKREREIYYTVGMTKAQIRTVAFLEILAVMITALILVPIFTFAMSVEIDNVLNSFGADWLKF